MQGRPTIVVDPQVGARWQQVVHHRFESRDGLLLADEQVGVGRKDCRNANRTLAFASDL